MTDALLVLLIGTWVASIVCCGMHFNDWYKKNKELNLYHHKSNR